MELVVFPVQLKYQLQEKLVSDFAIEPHQPLPISHNQSAVAPENIPNNRHNTSKFPKAFCSGPCRIKTNSVRNYHSIVQFT